MSKVWSVFGGVAHGTVGVQGVVGVRGGSPWNHWCPRCGRCLVVSVCFSVFCVCVLGGWGLGVGNELWGSRSATLSLYTTHSSGNSLHKKGLLNHKHTQNTQIHTHTQITQKHIEKHTDTPRHLPHLGHQWCYGPPHQTPSTPWTPMVLRATYGLRGAADRLSGLRCAFVGGAAGSFIGLRCASGRLRLEPLHS